MFLLTVHTILILTAIVNILLFAIIISDKHLTLRKPLLWFVLGGVIWTVGMCLFLTLQNVLAAMSVFAGASLALSAQNCLTASLFRQTFHRRLVCRLFCSIGLFFFLASFWHGALFTDYEITVRNGIIIERGFLYPFFVVFAAASVGTSVLMLFAKYRKLRSGRNKKNCLRIFVFAFSPAISLALITNAVLPYFGVSKLNILGPTASLAVTGTLIYVILRCRFLNTKPLIHLWLVYSVLTATFGIIYLGGLLFLDYVLFVSADISPFISAGITMIFGIFTFAQMEKFVRRKTDFLFFTERADYNKCLKKLNEVMTGNFLPDRLLKEVLKILDRELKVESVVFISEKYGYLTSDPTTCLEQVTDFYNEKVLAIVSAQRIPIRYDRSDFFSSTLQKLCRKYNLAFSLPVLRRGNFVGIFLIGRHKSGRNLNERDIKFVKHVAFLTLIALIKAELYRKNYRYKYSPNENVPKSPKSGKDISIFLHKLQTPLTVAKGHLGLLRRLTVEKCSVLEETIDTVSQKLYEEIFSSRQTVVSKKDRSSLFKQTNLAETIEDSLRKFCAPLQEKGIRLYCRTGQRLRLNAKDEQIRELLENLLENAAKYMPADKLKKILTLTARRKNKKISLVISDNGRGINHRELKNIFQPGFRAKNSRRTRGAGLGLARVKEIIETHGGRIKVKSFPDKGTRFDIELPLKQMR